MHTLTEGEALYQVVLEHVYLGFFLRVVRSEAVVVDGGGRAVVLVLWGVRVEDVHRPLLLGLRGLGLVLLLLRLILQRKLVTLHRCFICRENEILMTRYKTILGNTTTLPWCQSYNLQLKALSISHLHLQAP